MNENQLNILIEICLTNFKSNMLLRANLESVS
jgi:hypothetical protein